MIRAFVLAGAAATLPLALIAQEDGVTIELPEGEYVDILPPDEVSVEDGLVAWARIYEVASHPRCSNCHVGADNLPMWSGPSYGRTRPHGMNINAGDSRIGVEYVPCGTCHGVNDTGGNPEPHMAPQVAMTWQLAPVEAEWFGRDSREVCTQLRDPRPEWRAQLSGSGQPPGPRPDPALGMEPRRGP